VFLVGLLGLPVPLLTPLPIKIAVDSAVGSRPLPRLLQAVLPEGLTHAAASILVVATVLLVLIAVLDKGQQLASWVYQTYTGEKLVLEFRGRLFRHAQRLSLIYHETRGTSDSLYRITNDAPSIQYVTVFGFLPLLNAALILAGMIAVTASINVRLGLVALSVTPVLFILIVRSRKELMSRWTRAKQIDSAAMAVVEEVLSSIRVVKAFGKEGDEHRRYIGHASRSVSEQVQVALVSALFYLRIGLTIALGMAAALYIGITQVRSGLMSVGDLLVVMAYLTQIYGPLESASKTVVGLQSGLASARRAFALLDALPDVPEKPHAKTLSRARGAVTFQHVSFAYEKDHRVLDDICLEIPAGTRVGIAGPTGSGKTTFVNLLNRFYDPSSGAILLDGVDLRDYRVADVRSQFAVMLQDPVLFSTTIAENIAYARPEATTEQIIEAAKAANAHEFISRLPDGYETLVGERGMRLSGGERQRVSLARAFLKDAPILILDEPTSSVDVQTEAGIIDALQRLMHGRTTFMIAHRLSTLDTCDLRLYIERGRLAESPAAGPDSGESPSALSGAASVARTPQRS
jgi:ATP-binding cassette, subfamily B, bacterial